MRHFPGSQALLLFTVTVACCASFLACGDSGPTEADPGTRASGDGGLDGAASGDGGVNEAGGPVGAIQGQLLERTTSAPMPGRAIKLRGPQGKSVDLVSDASGKFSAPDVGSPYDLWVAPSGTTPASSSQVYLGLKATKLRVFAGDPAVPATPTNSGTILVDWTMPACGGGICKSAIVARMPDGTDKRASNVGYAQNQKIPNPLNVAATWVGASPATANVALVLTSTDGTNHYFATATASVTSGQSVLVTMTPQAVPSLGAATLAATAPAAPPFTTPSGVVRMALAAPLGEIELMTGAAGSPLPFTVPNIAGSTLRLYVTQLAGGGAFNAIGGTLAGVAPAAGAFLVPEGEPNPIVAPASGGSVSIASGSIDFRASSESRSRFVQLIRSDGPSTFVWVSEPKLSLSRLAGLGPPITKASIELAVEEHSRALDDIVADMTMIATDRTATTSYPATLTP